MEDKEDLSKENQGGATYDRFASSLTWQRQGKRTESELDESKMESKSWRQSERDKASDIGSDDEVEAEYAAALRNMNVGDMGISNDSKAKAIVKGFRINWMNMRDANTSRLMWEATQWCRDMYRRELKATVPSEILQCSAISREINFTSRQEIRQFRLEQRVFMRGACIEEWFFDFGFVIPGSTNSWQHTIESAGKNRMLAAQELSGRMTIETTFLDGKTALFKTLVRVFYE
ncbi:unnamed protein product [Ascophyllum nodosum]